jgi:hypothetical protein
MHFFYDAGSSGGVPSHIQHLVSRIQYSDATNACSVRDLRTRCARGNAMPPANQQPSTRRHRQGQLGKGKSVQLIGQRLLFHRTHEIDETEVGLVVGCLVELQGGLAFLGDICRGRLGRQCQRVLACERAGEGAVFWRTCCESPSGAVNINPETLKVRIKASLNALLERGRIQGGRVDAAKIGAGQQRRERRADRNCARTSPAQESDDLSQRRRRCAFFARPPIRENKTAAQLWLTSLGSGPLQTRR